jgi:hypothetical protein
MHLEIDNRKLAQVRVDPSIFSSGRIKLSLTDKSRLSDFTICFEFKNVTLKELQIDLRGLTNATNITIKVVHLVHLVHAILVRIMIHHAHSLGIST